MNESVKSKRYRTKCRPGHFCEICGMALTMRQTKPSFIKKGGGRFCSRKCASQWKSENLSGENSPIWKGGRKRIKQTCEICDKVFAANPSQVKKGRGRFCSTKCMGEWQSKSCTGENSPSWRGGQIERTCESCSSTFTAYLSRIKKGYGRFCSRKCFGQWMSENMSGENSPIWEGGNVELVCELCGNTFSVFPARAKRGNVRFCSHKCHGRWRSENLVGENNANWHGGKSLEPYPFTFNPTFKQKIRQRDEYTCALCGKSARCVHHINYIKDDTTPENCITLCRSCHTHTNYDRPHWQSTLATLMQERALNNYKVSLLGVELHWVEEE